MPRGIFGCRRLFSAGPFTYSAQVEDTEEIEQILVDILDNRGVQPGDDVTVLEFTEIADELTNEIYSDGSGDLFDTPIGPVFEEQIFRECIVSKWAELWEDGFTRATTGNAEQFEELIIQTNACVGIAEAGFSGIRVLRMTEQS